MEKTVTQRVYEHVAGAGRVVSTREVLAVLDECTPSSVTFALSRLVREGNLVRVAHGRYRMRESGDAPLPGTAGPEGASGLSWVLDDSRLVEIFEKIRPVLDFGQLAFLFETVTAAQSFVKGIRERENVRHESPGQG